MAGIVTSALTISCSEEGTGRRPGTDDGYIEIYENPNWKISADAAGLSAEVSVKSISNEYYYMDVIRLNEFTSTFGSDMKKYLQDEARMVRQQAEQESKSFNEFVSRGSSSVTFRDLTAGKSIPKTACRRTWMSSRWKAPMARITAWTS